MRAWGPMTLILLWPWREVETSCAWCCGTYRMNWLSNRGCFAISQAGGDAGWKLRRMELLRPSESTLSSIFLFLLVNGDLAHLEFSRSIYLRRKLLIFWVARLGRVRRAYFNWAPRCPKSLAKNIARLKRGLILWCICIECALLGDHSLLMLSWKIVGMINTRSVSHCSWGRSVWLRFSVCQLPRKMLLLISWLL